MLLNFMQCRCIETIYSIYAPSWIHALLLLKMLIVQGGQVPWLAFPTIDPGWDVAAGIQTQGFGCPPDVTLVSSIEKIPSEMEVAPPHNSPNS